MPVTLDARTAARIRIGSSAPFILNKGVVEQIQTPHKPQREDDGTIFVKGFVSMKSEDRHGDNIDPRIFDIDGFMSNPQLFFDHKKWRRKDGNEVNIGRVTSMHAVKVRKKRLDDNRAKFELVDLRGDREVVDTVTEEDFQLKNGDRGLWVVCHVMEPDAVDLVEQGRVNAFSWRGFLFEKSSGERVKADLHEVSLVLVPANQRALFAIGKNFDSPEDYLGESVIVTPQGSAFLLVEQDGVVTVERSREKFVVVWQRDNGMGEDIIRLSDAVHTREEAVTVARKFDASSVVLVMRLTDRDTEFGDPIYEVTDVVQSTSLQRNFGDDTAAAVDKGAISYNRAHRGGTPVAARGRAWDAYEEIRKADVDDLGTMSAWVDPKNANDKTSYRLLHHTAADNCAVVWDGVKSAMEALLDTYSDTQIPKGDRRAVYNHLARHYRDDFDEEPPPFREKISVESVDDEFVSSLTNRMTALQDVSQYDDGRNEDVDMARELTPTEERLLRVNENIVATLASKGASDADSYDDAAKGGDRVGKVEELLEKITDAVKSTAERVDDMSRRVTALEEEKTAADDKQAGGGDEGTGAGGGAAHKSDDDTATAGKGDDSAASGEGRGETDYDYDSSNGGSAGEVALIKALNDLVEKTERMHADIDTVTRRLDRVERQPSRKGSIEDPDDDAAISKSEDEKRAEAVRKSLESLPAEERDELLKRVGRRRLGRRMIPANVGRKP